MIRQSAACCIVWHHWGLAMDVYNHITYLVIIVSSSGLAPNRCQATAWNKDDLSFDETLKNVFQYLKLWHFLSTRCIWKFHLQYWHHFIPSLHVLEHRKARDTHQSGYNGWGSVGWAMMSHHKVQQQSAISSQQSAVSSVTRLLSMSTNYACWNNDDEIRS